MKKTAQRPSAAKKPSRKKAPKKQAKRKPESPATDSQQLLGAVRTPIHWTKDYDRNEIAIWLGEFQSTRDLDSYVRKQFYAELDVDPMQSGFFISRKYSKVPGDLSQLLKWTLIYYRTYAAKVEKRVAQLGLKSFNSVLAINGWFADKDFSKRASRGTFLGYFPYTEEKKKGLVNDAHIWLARFPSQKRLDQYMEEDYGKEGSTKPISQFARDQRASFYDHDLVYAQFEKDADLQKLVGCWGFPEKSVKQVVKAAGKLPLQEVNTCFVADRDEFLSPRSAKGKDYELWYVGQFDGCTH